MKKLFTVVLPAAVVAVGLATTTAAANASTAPVWKTQYSTNFTASAKLGSFSGCSNGDGPGEATNLTDYTCTGLPSALQSQWWAYPAGWEDTAKSGQLGKYKVGGLYEPQQTVSISGGMMVINEYNSGGYNHVAAVIPKAAIDKKYGRYIETTRVTAAPTGYKSAHLLWPDNADTTAQQNSGAEIDFPEGDWNDAKANGGDAYAYFHPTGNGAQQSYNSGVLWSAWHTYEIDWTPTSLTVKVDGVTKGSTTKAAYVPQMNMDWIIQNESSLDGQTSAPGPHAQMEISHVEYDSYISG